ncbi:MAG: hypothetical protein ABI652_07970 [Acidobacteriota bacterium]
MMQRHSRSTLTLTLLTALLVAAPMVAASVSRQQADVFAGKVGQITRNADPGGKPVPRETARRTPVTEDEINSWFTYRSQPLLPRGVTAPQVSIVGDGKVSGQAIVDLDAVAKRRATGGLFDPWSYIGGRVPVTVSGLLQTANGVGRFELQSAEISGIPVPRTVLQELVSYYSRTDDHPDGIRLDAPFDLPASIRQIDVGRGQAVVVQ